MDVLARPMPTAVAVVVTSNGRVVLLLRDGLLSTAVLTQLTAVLAVVEATVSALPS